MESKELKRYDLVYVPEDLVFDSTDACLEAYPNQAVSILFTHPKHLLTPQADEGLELARDILMAYPVDHHSFGVAGKFECCGGNDESPKQHTMDCIWLHVTCIQNLKAEHDKSAARIAELTGALEEIENAIDSDHQNFYYADNYESDAIRMRDLASEALQKSKGS